MNFKITLIGCIMNQKWKFCLRTPSHKPCRDIFMIPLNWKGSLVINLFYVFETLAFLHLEKMKFLFDLESYSHTNFRIFVCMSLILFWFFKNYKLCKLVQLVNKFSCLLVNNILDISSYISSKCFYPTKISQWLTEKQWINN